MPHSAQMRDSKRARRAIFGCEVSEDEGPRHGCQPSRPARKAANPTRALCAELSEPLEDTRGAAPKNILRPNGSRMPNASRKLAAEPSEPHEPKPRIPADGEDSRVHATHAHGRQHKCVAFSVQPSLRLLGCSVFSASPSFPPQFASACVLMCNVQCACRKESREKHEPLPPRTVDFDMLGSARVTSMIANASSSNSTVKPPEELGPYHANGASRERIQTLLTLVACKCTRRTCFTKFDTSVVHKFCVSFWSLSKPHQDALAPSHSTCACCVFCSQLARVLLARAWVRYPCPLIPPKNTSHMGVLALGSWSTSGCRTKQTRTTSASENGPSWGIPSA